MESKDLLKVKRFNLHNPYSLPQSLHLAEQIKHQEHLHLVRISIKQHRTITHRIKCLSVIGNWRLPASSRAHSSSNSQQKPKLDCQETWYIHIWASLSLQIINITILEGQWKYHKQNGSNYFRYIQHYTYFPRTLVSIST